MTFEITNQTIKTNSYVRMKWDYIRLTRGGTKILKVKLAGFSRISQRHERVTLFYTSTPRKKNDMNHSSPAIGGSRL